jgi:hypothetical protein
VAKNDKYEVVWLGAGQFSQGEIITEEQAGPWFEKWKRSGSIVPAKAGSKAAEEPEPGPDGLTGARAASEATGDDKIAETDFRGEAHQVEEPTVGAEKPSTKK